MPIYGNLLCLLFIKTNTLVGYLRSQKIEVIEVAKLVSYKIIYPSYETKICSRVDLLKIKNIKLIKHSKDMC